MVRFITYLLLSGMAVVLSACNILSPGPVERDEGALSSRGVHRVGPATTTLHRTKTAVVIGNALYRQKHLRTPETDATMMAAQLKTLGFDLIGDKALLNADKLAIEQAIKQLRKRLQQVGGVGLVYYAGHGAQIAGNNYLLPLKLEPEAAVDIEYGAVKVNWILASLNEAANPVNFLILDACRNNPYTRGFPNGTRGAGKKGLAKIEEQPSGSLIAFSTAANQEAQDIGKNGINSPYTENLLRFLKVPGLSAEALFRQVRTGVVKDTGHAQEPKEYTSLQGEKAFYFNGGPEEEEAKIQAKIASAQAQLAEIERKRNIEAQRLTDDKRRWQTAREEAIRLAEQVKVVERTKREDYPPPIGPSAEMVFWQRIVNSRRMGDFKEYLKRFPNGLYVDLAGNRLTELQGGDQSGQAMVPIQGGRFQMGSPEGETDRDSDEQLHWVQVDSFSLGRYEVTFEEYDRFCVATGRKKPSDRGWGRGRRPVINVSWHDAQAYIAWLNQQTGRRYRLPTEAEWEYAARAGTKTPFHTGECLSTEQANYAGNYAYGRCTKSNVYRKKTLNVGSLVKNAWGLYDMHGNVWEWTCSEYKNPYNGAEKTCNNHAKSDRRAARGGAWASKPRGVRAASRSGNSPGHRGYDCGFRLAQD